MERRRISCSYILNDTEAGNIARATHGHRILNLSPPTLLWKDCRRELKYETILFRKLIGATKLSESKLLSDWHADLNSELRQISFPWLCFGDGWH